MDKNMQFTINSFRQLFPDNSLIFSKIPDISLTAVKFPDISRFSRQAVTLSRGSHIVLVIGNVHLINQYCVFTSVQLGSCVLFTLLCCVSKEFEETNVDGDDKVIYIATDH